MNPTPNQIRQTRNQAGLSQTKAAELLGLKLRQWQYFESGEQVMKPIYWKMFKIEIADR